MFFLHMSAPRRWRSFNVSSWPLAAPQWAGLKWEDLVYSSQNRLVKGQLKYVFSLQRLNIEFKNGSGHLIKKRFSTFDFTLQERIENNEQQTFVLVEFLASKTSSITKTFFNPFFHLWLQGFILKDLFCILDFEVLSYSHSLKTQTQPCFLSFFLTVVPD